MHSSFLKKNSRSHPNTAVRWNRLAIQFVPCWNTQPGQNSCVLPKWCEATASLPRISLPRASSAARKSLEMSMRTCGIRTGACTYGHGCHLDLDMGTGPSNGLRLVDILCYLSVLGALSDKFLLWGYGARKCKPARQNLPVSESLTVRRKPEPSMCFCSLNLGNSRAGRNSPPPMWRYCCPNHNVMPIIRLKVLHRYLLKKGKSVMLIIKLRN